MNLVPVYVSCGLVSYLTGAIPFGYVITRMKGIDIRKVGSGNIGATNVVRALGKKWGILTFLCDVLKGFIAAFVIPVCAERIFAIEGDYFLQIASGCCAVAGHNWPIYLRFKGGKGVATTAGVLLGIGPVVLVIGLGIWAVFFLLFRYVSLASIIASLSLAGCAWIFYSDGVRPMAFTVLALLAIIRHKANIVRLLKGTEDKFVRKKERTR